MALKGTRNGSVTLNSSYFTFYLEWSATQSISGNYSDVVVTTYVKTNNTYQTFDTVGSRNHSITIDGTTTNLSKVIDCDPWNSNGIYLIQTASKRVYHNDDGTKSITISARSNGHALSWGYSSSTASSNDATISAFTITLDTIPRASSISSISNDGMVVNGSNELTVNIARHSTSFTHTVKIEFGSYSATLEKQGTSAKYKVPTSWLGAIPSALSGTGTVYVTTYSGSTKIGDTVSKNFTLAVPNYSPNFSGVSATVVQDSRISDWNIYVQRYSRVKFTFNGASGVYGSNISKYEVAVDGVTYSGTANNYTSNVLNGTGSLSYTAKVTDSRGKTASKSGTITVQTLVTPKFTSANIYRYDGSKENDEGTQLYFKFDFTFESYSGLNGTVNEIYIKKDTDSSYSKYGTFTNGTPLIITNYVFDDNSSYDIRVIVTDELGNKIQYDKTVLSAMALIDSDGVNNGLGLLRRSSKENTVQIGGNLEIEGYIDGDAFGFDETMVHVIGKYTLDSDHRLRIKRKIIPHLSLVAGSNLIGTGTTDFMFPLRCYGAFAQKNGIYQIFPESCCDDVAGFGISIRDIKKDQINILLGTKYTGDYAPVAREGHIVIEYVSTENF